MIFIGIDPAFRKSGFVLCCIDTSDNTVSFKTIKNRLLDFMSWIKNDAPAKEDCIICVENSNLQDEFFYTHRAVKSGALLSYEQAKFIKSRPLTQGESNKANRDVGKNMATSQMAVDFLNVFGYEVLDLSPKEKGNKWNEFQFQQIAKQNKHSVPKTTTQDERDAYKLADIAKTKQRLLK